MHLPEFHTSHLGATTGIYYVQAFIGEAVASCHISPEGEVSEPMLTVFTADLYSKIAGRFPIV